MARASAESFEPVGASACEEVRDTAACDAATEAGKDRFAHPIRRGTCGIAFGRFDLNAASFAACDAHAVAGCWLLVESCPLLVACC